MTTETRLTRTVIDGGIEFEISVPDTWLEVPVVGSVLALAGRTEDDDETLNPSLLVMVDEAESAAEAFDTIRSALADLPEAEVGFDQTGERDGLDALALGVSFRHPGTGALQIENLFAVFVPGSPGLVVRATATCGGGASEEVVSALAAMVTSLSTRRVQG